MKGFTLVELVIVIAIVIVLSVVSVPIYRSYVDKAKMSEAYALMGTILSAQKAYYSEYGNFLAYSGGAWTQYDPVLGIDVRGNKYFTHFHSGAEDALKYYFYAGIRKPNDLQDEKSESYEKHVIYIHYNITRGSNFNDGYFDDSWKD